MGLGFSKCSSLHSSHGTDMSKEMFTMKERIEKLEYLEQIRCANRLDRLERLQRRTEKYINPACLDSAARSRYQSPTPTKQADWVWYGNPP
ncbi:FirrV-1-A35 [Feldmannia irregularis virus a]|uniref:FirrV-1-A35 n=1 Tax=Feldmannia irregularis virus a TaxID=231992 RepID=Q6XM52_9PHYC|nr:FirrV-1-A35 [Feldmannia irregularis virus a]AAR26859.1 FirrV-1-A35 [Feldmannia irregularis virus a]